MGELRPRYYYFKGYSAAKEYADKLNARARVNRWLVRANIRRYTADPGYTVYNIRREVCPMLTEPHGEAGSIDQFQDRMNQEVRL